MNSLSRFINQFQRRTLLIAAAVVLLVLNMGRWALSTYDAETSELESKITRLEQARFVAAQLDPLKDKLAKVDRVKAQVEGAFFKGESSDKMASAMQLRLQSLVSQAGLESESLRPTHNPGDNKTRQDAGGNPITFEEVLVKARLVGTLGDFMEFMSMLYKSKEFFKIDNITLKPYKKAGLKIFIELRGFYILADKPAAQLPAGDANDSPEATS